MRCLVRKEEIPRSVCWVSALHCTVQEGSFLFSSRPLIQIIAPYERLCLTMTVSIHLIVVRGKSPGRTNGFPELVDYVVKFIKLFIN